MNNKNFKIEYILRNFPLRVIVTDYCNLRCFFCSNEGMAPDQKNRLNADYSLLKYLIEVLSSNDLTSISLTGGEPAIYPQIRELIQLINRLPFESKFFHTNGVGLTSKLINSGLKEFTKIAVSVHSFDPCLWQKLTGGDLGQYRRTLKGLSLLKKTGFCKEVEIKHVVIRGFNDTLRMIKKTLDFCSQNKFKFKFLNFEPIREDQCGWSIPISKMKKKLEFLGCQLLPSARSFRGQSDYLPLIWYQYRQTKGVLIEIGCGTPEVCRACWQSNEIVVTPRLEIKPCHMSQKTIPLGKLLKNKDETGVLQAIVESRKMLRERPGEDKFYWNQN
jgi:cyclic pyranopterin phosphate synthase